MRLFFDQFLPLCWLSRSGQMTTHFHPRKKYPSSSGLTLIKCSEKMHQMKLETKCRFAPSWERDRAKEKCFSSKRTWQRLSTLSSVKRMDRGETSGILHTLKMTQSRLKGHKGRQKLSALKSLEFVFGFQS